MPRTRITPITIPATGLNLTDLTYDPIPSTLGAGVEFEWAPEQYLLLWNPDDSGPPGHIVYVNSSVIDGVGGVDGSGFSNLVTNFLITIELQKLHIAKCEKVFRQNNGLVYVDSIFGTYMKVLNLA